MEANEPTSDDKTAAAAFEAIPELVEHMLLALPLPDILLAQQVSRTWNTLIKNSPKLQRALFLRPSQDVQLIDVANTYQPYTCSCKVSKATNKTACKLLSNNSSYHRQFNIVQQGMRWASNSADNENHHITLNPFLAAFPWDPSRLNYPSFLNVGKFPSKTFRGASWRHMLITQPPLKELVVDYISTLRSHCHMIRAKPGSAGITIDDLRLHANVFPRETRARYLGSGAFNVVHPPASWTWERRPVTCTGEDVTSELEKNHASSGGEGREGPA